MGEFELRVFLNFSPLTLQFWIKDNFIEPRFDRKLLDAKR